ncbi:rhodanese-like domain-containing protein [Campylobacter sp. MIT 99-7217]|uniref:rhodanese-like domain-containing protein n=1 Tax=Campylobacter sp. MIT 99-7217 TaxID=535091 RepID=UPI001157A052|nr:rhodanese-like domain-containing protein [Campylobacter sp. MIT 99-7217]TQR33054.1 rhodanese-like domain-containing protein [Campylobacter sp. MIT 99-7217]
MILSVDADAEILGAYQIFDIRNKHEWRQTGVIKDAILLSFNQNNGSPNPEFLSEFKRLADFSRPIALICASGFRSHVATHLIKAKLGIEVTNLKGGMYKLLREGFECEPYRGQDFK